jgi:putative membrane protein
VTRTLLLVLGLGVLAWLWLGGLPASAATSFSAHMLLHTGVIAVAAPLLALAVSGTAIDPAVRWPGTVHPVAASVADLVVVWGWHAPLFHLAARQHTGAFVAEQVSYLAAGLWLWLAAWGGLGSARSRTPWAGVGALLFTSVHMTLLAALFALAPRDVYGAGAGGAAAQHVGGGVMLLLGGGTYLAGALWLARHGLRGPEPRRALS